MLINLFTIVSFVSLVNAWWMNAQSQVPSASDCSQHLSKLILSSLNIHQQINCLIIVSYYHYNYHYYYYYSYLYANNHLYNDNLVILQKTGHYFLVSNTIFYNTTTTAPTTTMLKEYIIKKEKKCLMMISNHTT